MIGLESRSKKLEVASTQLTLSGLGGDRVANMAVLSPPWAERGAAKRAHPPGTGSAMKQFWCFSSVWNWMNIKTRVLFVFLGKNKWRNYLVILNLSTIYFMMSAENLIRNREECTFVITVKRVAQSWQLILCLTWPTNWVPRGNLSATKRGKIEPGCYYYYYY